jgi:2-C-methyl-D-erythritol 4-phosphate cytidylyltransferase
MSKMGTTQTIVIIPSAGLGLRMGGKSGLKKNYIAINGRPILARTIEVFENTPEIDAIIVVTGRQDIEYCQGEIVDKFNFTKVTAILKGGETRQDSVANALRYVAENLSCEVVLVHDGARPLITKEIIVEVINSTKKHGSGVAAVPVKDTIKEVTNEGTVQATLPREKLRAIQTPQGFPSGVIIEASAKASADNVTCTDESSLVERLGTSVWLTAGSYENIKITTVEDIKIAEAILNRRSEENQQLNPKKDTLCE